MEAPIVVVDNPRHDYSIYNDYYPIEDCQAGLSNKELWDQFHDLQTEMIITKTGRRMFPSLNVQISKLDPSADYCIFLEMSLAHHCRFKYSSSVGWSPAGHEEAQSPQRLYMHPESPSKGAQWMAQNVSFSRLKLTNTCAPPPGQIVLSSMHKYQPRILIVKTSNPSSLGWSPSKSIAFPETQFIAVTAYQNEKITKLKINYNPFAKGFRDNGKSSVKRKHVTNDGEALAVTKKKVVDGGSENATPSPPPVVPLYRYYYPPYPVYTQWWASPAVPFYFQTIKRQDFTQPPPEAKSRKITDFSINAIMRHA